MRLLLACLVLLSGLAQAQDENYTAPRTEHGFPDLQGLWLTSFATMTERPPGITDLVVPPEIAEEISANVFNMFASGNADPDFELVGQLPLLMINGEYRSSVITSPADGQIPFNENGERLTQRADELFFSGYDGPEQRDLSERCLLGMSGPPITALPIRMPRKFVQTENYLMMYAEDAAGLRIIKIGEAEPNPGRRTLAGYSVGEWQGDTLVVTTTHIRADYPYRFNVPRSIVVSEDTVITEWFTRQSDELLHYAYEVVDNSLYTEAWRGEFVMTAMEGGSYAYECHEGNYSLPGILRGGIVDRLRAETETD